MSWLLLLFALTSALLTSNVYRPIHSHARRAGFSFAMGWMTGELALHSILLQVLIALLLISVNAVKGLPGQLGLGILIVSWAALALDYGRSLGTRNVIEKALRAGLGARYLDDITEDQKASFEKEVRWRPILLPLPIRRPEVECIRGILYAHQGGINLKLDVYRHCSHPRGTPTLLQIHGGGWMVGTKDHQALPLMNHLASRGWTCFSVNYRRSPLATFPDHIIDVKRAVKWIRENGEQYGANPDFIVVTGGSAGGHLASLLALTPNDPGFQPGFEEVDTSVRGCVPLYGVYDFTNRHGQQRNRGLKKVLEQWVMKTTLAESPEAYRRASPVDRISGEVPPFFVIQGARDTLVPVEEARHFVEALNANRSSPVIYAEIPGAQHAFELCSTPRAQAAVDGIERFLAFLHSRYLALREQEPVDRGKVDYHAPPPVTADLR